MHRLDRRWLLAGSSALGLAAAAPRFAFADDALKPPVASVRPVTETLHGVTVTDPYRWMETPTDPEWKPYLMGQNAYARAVLATIPGREALAARIGFDLGQGDPDPARCSRPGGMIFSEIRPAEANTFKVYVRRGATGEDRLLLDPDGMASAGTHFSIDYWIALAGRPLRRLRPRRPPGRRTRCCGFLDVASGTALPEAIDQAQFGGVFLAAEQFGFFFTRLKEGTKHGDPDHYLDAVVWLHKLNTDPATDIKLLTKGLDPRSSDAGHRYAVDLRPGRVGRGDRRGPGRGAERDRSLRLSARSRVRLRKPVWTPVCTRADGVTSAILSGHDLLLLTHQGAPRYRVVKTSFAEPNSGEGRRGGSAIRRGGEGPQHGARRRLCADLERGDWARSSGSAPMATKTVMRLPYPGTIGYVSTDPLADGCWFALDSCVKPQVLCYGAPDGTVSVNQVAP